MGTKKEKPPKEAGAKKKKKLPKRERIAQEERKRALRLSRQSVYLQIDHVSGRPGDIAYEKSRSARRVEILSRGGKKKELARAVRALEANTKRLEAIERGDQEHPSEKRVRMAREDYATVETAARALFDDVTERGWDAAKLDQRKELRKLLDKTYKRIKKQGKYYQKATGTPESKLAKNRGWVRADEIKKQSRELCGRLKYLKKRRDKEKRKNRKNAQMRVKGRTMATT